jgi:hypothetical protein
MPPDATLWPDALVGATRAEPDVGDAGLSKPTSKGGGRHFAPPAVAPVPGSTARPSHTSERQVERLARFHPAFHLNSCGSVFENATVVH